MSGSVFGGASSNVARLLHPGYPAGTFTWMGNISGSLGLGSSDNLRLYPFRVAQRRRVSSINMYTATGGAGSAVKCAVWRNDYSTARPIGVPVLGQNAGFDTTGTGPDTAAISDVWLDAGIWWGGRGSHGNGADDDCYQQHRSH